MKTTKNERFKVLLVTTSFPFANNKASGIFVKRLADVLHKRVELTVLTPCSACSNSPLPADYRVICFPYAISRWQRIAHEPGGIPVAIARNPLNLFLLPTFFLMLFLNVLYYGRSSNIIHANWSYTGFFAGIAAFLIKKPMITTFRGSDTNAIHKSQLARIVTAAVLKMS